MIIPDFQNLYTNKSYLSREEQVRQFRKLVEKVNEQIPDVGERYMQINLHGLLYSELSAAASGETIFMAADMVSIGLLSDYIERLRPDNILVASELDDTMDYSSEEFFTLLRDYLDMLNKELPMQFTIMIFPYRMLAADIEMWLKYIDNMLAYKGRIILYDCPDKVPITDGLSLITDYLDSDSNKIKMLQTKKSFVPSEIYTDVSLRIKKLYDDIIEATQNEIRLHELDRLIYEAWILEKEIIRHHDEFHDGDIKYKVNEIKNGLLDLRYSDGVDRKFFVEVLRNEILPYIDNIF